MRRKLLLIAAIAVVARFALTARRTGCGDRYATTVGEMRDIATALDELACDRGWYAVGPADVAAPARVRLDDLQRALVPKYLRRLPRRDGLGHDLDVRLSQRDAHGHAHAYAIRSFGPDGGGAALHRP